MSTLADHRTPTGAPARQRRWGPRPSTAAAVTTAASGLVAAGMFLLLRNAMVDDGYITMTYARNLAQHLHWGLLTSVTSNTATSPGYVLALGAATFVLRSPVVAVGALFVLSAATTTAALWHAARATGVPVVAAPVATALLVTNPLLLSTMGLETYFLLALAALLLACAASGRVVAFGVVAGVLVLTRVDAGILVAVLALGVGAVLRRLWLAVLAAAVVTVPWYLFSWVVLGSAIPDTLILKTGERPWAGVFVISNGLKWFYYGAYPVATFLSVVAPIAGLVAVVAALVSRWTRFLPADVRVLPWALLAVGAVLHYLAYCALGVPPYHWYYGASLGSASIAGAGCAAAVIRSSAARHPRLVAREAHPLWHAAVGVGLVGALVGAGATAAVFDINRGEWQVTALSSNFARPAEYRSIGRDLADRLAPGEHVTSPGEIGTLEFTCDCVTDQFSDPYLLGRKIQARMDASTGFRRTLLGWNYHFREQPRSPVPVVGRLDFEPRGTPGGDARWDTDGGTVGPLELRLTLRR